MRASIIGAMAAIALWLGSVHLVACAAPPGSEHLAHVIDERIADCGGTAAFHRQVP